LLVLETFLNYFTIFVLFNESLFTVFIISIAQQHRHFDLTTQHIAQRSAVSSWYWWIPLAVRPSGANR
jgi:hypothetical protein